VKFEASPAADLTSLIPLFSTAAVNFEALSPKNPRSPLNFTPGKLTNAVDCIWKEAIVTMNDLQDIAKLAATPKAEGLPGHTKIKATIKEYEARKQKLEEKDHDTEDAQAERSRKETVFRSKLDPGKPPSSDAIGGGGETEHVDNVSNAAGSLAAVENAPVNNSAPPCTMPEVASTPLRPTNTSTVPVPPTMAAATRTTKKVIDPLEAVRQRIVSLETGTPLSKSISKRDPLAIDRKKRTKSRQKPYICPGKEFCKSLLCAHEADNAKEEQEKL